jgi:hypothetical protein
VPVADSLSKIILPDLQQNKITKKIISSSFSPDPNNLKAQSQASSVMSGNNGHEHKSPLRTDVVKHKYAKKLSPKV